ATFSIADNSGTISYGSGDTYSYKAGDLVPSSLSGSDIVYLSNPSYYRSAGSNSETWNGQTSEGTAADHGLYPMGLFARDRSDNTAISRTGNDQPYFPTIYVDRRTSDSTAEGNAPTLVSVTPSSGTTVSSLSQVSVTLSDSSGVNASATSILVSFGTVTYSHGDGATQDHISGTYDSYTLTFSTALTSQGSYSITIIATDVFNNQTTYSTTFNVSGTGAVSESFKDSVLAYPQPAAGGSITFRYDNSNTFFSGTVTLTIEVFTIFGEKVMEYSGSNSSRIYTWNYSGLGLAPGVYIYKLKAAGNAETYEAVNKAVIYK
ncbi:MAG: T9SS type A sorting domain-containing protein, partial [Planctomycetota bacterium]